MKPRGKVGLIAGFLGLVLGVFVYFIVGILFPYIIRFPLEVAYPIFGLFYLLLVGAAAGNFAVKKERVLVARDGARVGAISGGIAGAMMAIVPLGCWIGGIAVIDESGWTGVELRAIGLVLVAGIGVLVAATLGGAAGGYLRASSSTAEDLPSVE
jgi:hypothetical protein